MTTFAFYCDLQRHIANLFDQQITDQTLPQEAFWEILRNSWTDQLAAKADANLFEAKADAFIDGLQHNFTKLRLLDSEYLIDGVWTPIAEAPAARLRDADCRIVWKKTGIVWGVILYSQYPLEPKGNSPFQPRLLSTNLTLEKSPKPETQPETV